VVACPNAIRGRGLIGVNGKWFDIGELRRIDAALVVDENGIARERRAGLEVQAVAQLGLDDA